MVYDLLVNYNFFDGKTTGKDPHNASNFIKKLRLAVSEQIKESGYVQGVEITSSPPSTTKLRVTNLLVRYFYHC
jgi:hypothetical protein